MDEPNETQSTGPARGQRIKKVLAREWLYFNGWVFAGLLVLLGIAGVRGLAWRLERSIVRKHGAAMRAMWSLAHAVEMLGPDGKLYNVPQENAEAAQEAGARVVESSQGNTFTVRMPDGTLVKNVPEGTTRAEFLAKLTAHFGQQGAQRILQAAPQEQIEPTQPVRIPKGAVIGGIRCVKLSADETPGDEAVEVSGWDGEIDRDEPQAYGNFVSLYDELCVSPSRARGDFYSILDTLVQFDPWDYRRIFILAPYFIFLFIRSLLLAVRTAMQH